MQWQQQQCSGGAAAFTCATQPSKVLPASISMFPLSAHQHVICDWNDMDPLSTVAAVGCTIIVID